MTTAQFDNGEREILKQLDEDLKADGELDNQQTAQQDDPQQGQTDPAAAPAAAPAPAPAAAPAAAPAPAPAAPAPAPAPVDTQPPQGDTRAALRASRHAERRARALAERLSQELADLKAGKTAPDTSISDEELADLEKDFPVVAKVARRNRQLEGQVESLRQPVDQGFEPPTYEDPSIQDAIDTVPQLVAWQYDPDGQDKFARAIEHDELLKVEPAWHNRPLADRLAEVTRRVLAEAAPAPQPQRKDPQAVIAAAPTTLPTQISDFKGGALPNKTEPDYSRMSDEEIMRSLPRV